MKKEELTWKDLKRLWKIRWKMPVTWEGTEEEWYKELLKRFKNEKETEEDKSIPEQGPEGHPLTKETWQNMVKAICQTNHYFDALDEIELAMAYEKVSGEKIPDDWRILY